jgi:hypothetical protein
MAAYDEYMYQLAGQQEDTPCCVSGVCDHHLAVHDAFDAGVAHERARVTEVLALNTNILEVLLVHGEWPRRVSLYKWGGPSWKRAQELRAEAREILDPHTGLGLTGCSSF